MTKQDIIDYIMETPGNTNPAILSQFLDEMGGDESNEGKYPVVYRNNANGVINIEYYDPDGVITFPELPEYQEYWDWSAYYDDGLLHSFRKFEGDTLAVSIMKACPGAFNGAIFTADHDEPEGS